MEQAMGKHEERTERAFRGIDSMMQDTIKTVAMREQAHSLAAIADALEALPKSFEMLADQIAMREMD